MDSNEVSECNKNHRNRDWVINVKPNSASFTFSGDPVFFFKTTRICIMSLILMYTMTQNHFLELGSIITKIIQSNCILYV